MTWLNVPCRLLASMQSLNLLALTVEMASVLLAWQCSHSLGEVPHFGFYLCRHIAPSALALTGFEPWSAAPQLKYARVISMMVYVIDKFSSSHNLILWCDWTRYRRLHWPVELLDRINQRWATRGWIIPPTFITCNSSRKRPTCHTSWPLKLMHLGLINNNSNNNGYS